jgi:hypothetical protein
MARRSTAVFANENSQSVDTVLRFVKELRLGYESAPDGIENCDQIVTRIRGLLRNEEVRRILNAMLAEQGETRPGLVLEQGDWLEEEAKLGSVFGYSPSEVKRYVRRIRKEAGLATLRVEISNVEDLIRQLEALHAQTKQGMAPTGSWFSRWRALRRVRRQAQDRLFYIGAIIADTMKSNLFNLSYTVALVGLSQGTGDE